MPDRITVLAADDVLAGVRGTSPERHHHDAEQGPQAEDPRPDGRHRRAVHRAARPVVGPPGRRSRRFLGEHLAWSGPDWYAFPPEPPQGTGLGLGNGRNQRYYWEARRRWAPWQVRQHARMAAELTGGRARHLADWYPEGWAPYHGRTRDLALELLYVITLHDWPDLVPDPFLLAAHVAAGDPMPVDAAFAEFDRHARLLTDDGLHPPTGELVGQATSILQQQAASTTGGSGSKRSASWASSAGP